MSVHLVGTEERQETCVAAHYLRNLFLYRSIITLLCNLVSVNCLVVFLDVVAVFVCRVRQQKLLKKLNLIEVEIREWRFTNLLILLPPLIFDKSPKKLFLVGGVPFEPYLNFGVGLGNIQSIYVSFVINSNYFFVDKDDIFALRRVSSACVTIEDVVHRVHINTSSVVVEGF